MPTTTTPAGRFATNDLIGTTTNVSGLGCPPLAQAVTPIWALSSPTWVVSVRSACAISAPTPGRVDSTSLRSNAVKSISAGPAGISSPAVAPTWRTLEPSDVSKYTNAKGRSLPVPRQNPSGHGASVFARFCLRDPGAELAQYSDPTFANDLLGGFVHGGQHTTDAARRTFIRNRTVSDRKVRFFRKSVSNELDLQILHPGRRPPEEGRVDQRFQNVPDLGPALRNRPAQEPRMFGTQDRPIGIVVDLDVLRPPPQQHGKPVGQHNAHHHAQTGRPARLRARAVWPPQFSSRTRRAIWPSSGSVMGTQTSGQALQAEEPDYLSSRRVSDRLCRSRGTKQFGPRLDSGPWVQGLA